MKSFLFRFLAFTAFLSFQDSLVADLVRDQHVEAELVAETTSIQPGRPFTVALRLKMDKDWHTYWQNPGDAGLATTLDWKLPEGFKAGPIQWPVPKIFKFEGLTNYGYEDEVFLLVEITPPKGLSPGWQATLAAHCKWLMCADICIPGKADLTLTLPVAETPPFWDDGRHQVFERMRERLPKSLPEWKVTAFREGSRALLKIESESEANPSPDSIYFFSADAQVEPNAPQSLKREGKTLFLELNRASFAEATTTLSGVLYSERGWLPNGTAPAMAVKQNFAVGPIPSWGTTVGRVGGNDSSTLSNFIAVLGVAFLGGLILNLMPCVFPVLGLKIMGFVKQAGEERSKVALHGLVFTSGVLISFWVLAGILLTLRTGGEELGWGFQLQSPAFVFSLTAVLFVFALNLSGLFEVGLSATAFGSQLSMRSGLIGSFFSGVLATVVATPCAAPFLATALGAALTLRAVESLFVFTLIGLGLSLPYLILSFFPTLVQLLPKPGTWMETFKQLMAFLLYASASYLLWVLAGQVQEERLLRAFFALVLIGMACWIYGRWSIPARKTVVRRYGQVATAAVLISGIYTFFAQPEKFEWEEWSPGKVARLKAEGRAIYIDFTARWCATCQTNKKLVFSSEKVRNTFREKKVAALKADWTKQDPQITEALAQFNRSAVPFSILYLPAKDEPIILPELLTPRIMLEALDRL